MMFRLMVLYIRKLRATSQTPQLKNLNMKNLATHKIVHSFVLLEELNIVLKNLEVKTINVFFHSHLA